MIRGSSKVRQGEGGTFFGWCGSEPSSFCSEGWKASSPQASFLFVVHGVHDPPAEEAEFIDVHPRAGGDIKGHLVSDGFGSAEGLGMEFAGSTAENIKKLTFLLHLGIAGDEAAKGVEMGFDAESLGRREGGEFFGFGVAEIENPGVEPGLLFGGQFKKAAVGSRFHNHAGFRSECGFVRRAAPHRIRKRKK